MSRRVIAALIAAVSVPAAAVLAVVTNIVTAQSLPSWADWLTEGSRAWWSLAGLAALIVDGALVASQKYGMLKSVWGAGGYGPIIGQAAESMCAQHLALR